MTSANDYLSGLTIGTVERVTAGEIVVRLLEDAPHGTALNSGTPTRFPKIHGPLVIPSEYGSIVGLTTEVEAERLRSVPDVELVRMPIPLRRIALLPLGVIRHDASGYTLNRGLHVFPTVGDPVSVPTRAELGALTSVSTGSASIEIGRSVLATRAAISVDIDRMLTRHLAVLGNTGSGKSCSVALVLRAAIDRAASSTGPGMAPRVIVLDTNGEFARTFDDLGLTVRRFAVDPQEGDHAEQLRVPGWLWNSSEWVAATGASSGAQAPYIRRSLALLKKGAHVTDVRKRRASVMLSRGDLKVRSVLSVGPSTEFGARQDEGRIVESLDDIANSLSTSESDELAEALRDLSSKCGEIREDRYDGRYWEAVSLEQWEELHEALANVLGLCIPEDNERVANEDDPIPFDVGLLAELIELEALEESSGSALGWVAPLLFRLRGLLGDRQISSLAGTPAESQEETLDTWLENMVGQSQVTVIDLSLVPATVLHVIVAVLTRVLFEAHQRYRRVNGEVLPTVLVAEEAHHFLRRRHPASGDTPVTASELCAQSFERIAREGRKLGLSLVVTSQRPSEVSETVLSQCNTFLVHRVVNDFDQQLIRRLVPDSLGSLVEELPALPARTAILMGWASEVPMMVEMSELDAKWRPASEDPPLFQEWSKQPEPDLWKDVVAQWTQPDE